MPAISILIYFLIPGFLYILLAANEADGFAMHMTRKHCDRSLLPGTVIMGKESVVDTERGIKIFQGDSEVKNGSTLHSLNDLKVTLDPKTTQLVLETSLGASFVNGSCEGTRTTSNGATLVITPDLAAKAADGKIIIRGAWSRSYSSGVKLTEPFELYLPASARLQIGNQDL